MHARGASVKDASTGGHENHRKLLGRTNLVDRRPVLAAEADSGATGLLDRRDCLGAGRWAGPRRLWPTARIPLGSGLAPRSRKRRDD